MVLLDQSDSLAVELAGGSGAQGLYLVFPAQEFPAVVQSGVVECQTLQLGSPARACVCRHCRWRQSMCMSTVKERFGWTFTEGDVGKLVCRLEVTIFG